MLVTGKTVKITSKYWVDVSSSMSVVVMAGPGIIFTTNIYILKDTNSVSICRLP